MLFIIKDMTNEDMTNEDMKKCNKCLKEMTIDNFYKINEFYYQSRCKTCHNDDRKKYKNDYKKYYKYEKKGSGILKLKEEVVNNIKKDILSSKYNYKEICNRNDLKYSTLMSWIKKGQLPKKETIKSKVLRKKKEEREKEERERKVSLL